MRVLLLAAGLLLSASAVAQLNAGYIVLFKQAELSISTMEHGEFQNALQTANTKSVTQLKEWIDTRGFQAQLANAQDLWLVRGARVLLDTELAKKLSKEPWVQGVHPDAIRKFVHPSATLQVGQTLSELGETEKTLWGLKRIGLDKVRAEFPELDGTGVRVGIIDTGIQARHPEVAGRTIRFRDFVSKIELPYDDQGHGTHVAGTIAGVRVGIAPKANLVVAKAFTAMGSAQDSDLIAAMQWMFDPDGDPRTDDFPHLVSNSWGANLGDVEIQNLAQFAPYSNALQAWVRGGIIPIFAAGNSGMSPNGFPGGFPEALAVGALGPSDAMADFSSRGPNVWRMADWTVSLLKPDISAPGEKITSAFIGNKYATWDGTSMATPHVAGIVALAVQANPKLKYARLKQLLLESSERKADLSFGYGIMDGYKFLKTVLNR